jgi:hypothetical protein
MKLPSFGMDRYDRRARLMPALFAVLPITLTVIALAPDAIKGWSGALAVAIQAGGSLVLAQIVGDIGKKKELGLYARFGGRPTDRLLSHKTAPNKTILAMRHAKLQGLMQKVKIPTAAAEEKNPAGAADVYAACVDVLRGKCRGNEAVFRENMQFGFRRNLWGVKKLGIIAALIGVLVVGAEVYGLASAHERVSPAFWLIGGLNLLILAAWIFFITPAWVIRAGNLYADRLIEVLDSM